MTCRVLIYATAIALGMPSSVLAEVQPSPPPTAIHQQADHFEWVTLGTVGGPVPQPGRNEPANLLARKGEAHLVDAGDGAATALVEAGSDYRDVQTIWISHIHFDHIGGLFAILGLRLQSRINSPLTIYGPPGMKDIVSGLITAMQPSARSGFGVVGETAISPASSINVVELDDGSVVKLGSFTVRAAVNSHYSFVHGSAEAKYFRSLSYRFDLPERSIVYTGDTGPSENVVALAKNADMLVTEMVDLEMTPAKLGTRLALLSENERKAIVEHLATHHLKTSDIGSMAQRAGVKSVVVTHIAGGATDRGASARYVSQISQIYKGPVIVANDLDRF